MKHFFALLPSFFHRFQFLHFYMNNKRTTRTTRTTVTTVTKNEQQQHQVQNHAKEGKLMSRTEKSMNNARGATTNIEKHSKNTAKAKKNKKNQ